MKNKESLREAIIEALNLDLATASKAADAARETATSKETVAENKYDTFSLEASYLAHGQSKRAAELLEAIACYRALPFAKPSETTEIGISTLVTLEADDETRKYFFIGPDAGGLKLRWQDMDIMIITPHTPLGHQLIGKQQDDSVDLLINNKHITYDIVAIA